MGPKKRAAFATRHITLLDARMSVISIQGASSILRCGKSSSRRLSLFRAPPPALRRGRNLPTLQRRSRRGNPEVHLLSRRRAPPASPMRASSFSSRVPRRAGLASTPLREGSPTSGMPRCPCRPRRRRGSTWPGRAALRCCGGTARSTQPTTAGQGASPRSMRRERA